MSIPDDKKFDALFDHYNDTFKYIQEYAKTRERLFLMALMVVLVMSFDLTSAVDATQVVSEVIEKKLGLKFAINPAFIGSLLWFALLSVLIRYFQTSILVNRQYSYIHQVEEHLRTLLEGDYISREGKAYAKGYPIFSKWTRLLYTIIFPLFLLLVVCVKTYKDYGIRESLGMTYPINLILFIMIAISVALYWVQLHFKK